MQKTNVCCLETRARAAMPSPNFTMMPSRAAADDSLMEGELIMMIVVIDIEFLYIADVAATEIDTIRSTTASANVERHRLKHSAHWSLKVRVDETN